MIQYVRGDVTEADLLHPHEKGILIPHVLSKTGAYHAGVAAAIANKWPSARESFISMLLHVDILYGDVHFAHVQLHSKEVWVANMVAMRGVRFKDNPHPLDLPSLHNCLIEVIQFAFDRTLEIHMPKIGSGLAGGNWEEIERLIIQVSRDYSMPLIVHEYP